VIDDRLVLLEVMIGIAVSARATAVEDVWLLTISDRVEMLRHPEFDPLENVLKIYACCD
jgi:hypothetical protein